MLSLRGVWVAAAVLVLGSPAHAKPAHLKSFQEHYGQFLGKGLDACGTCHRASASKAPSTLAEFPHNAFGDRLRKIGEQLSAAGQRADIAARLKAIGAEDTDGDGAGNEVEILSGR